MHTMGLSSRPAAAPAQRLTVADLPGLLIGGETVAPTLRGPQRYVNFDNAASTPTFRPVAEAVMEFLQWYANVHRGTGFKSQLASWAFEEARDIIAGFIRADLQRQVVIFTKNTTEAINKLARRLSTSKHDVILTTLMEHHSNELPWRRVGTVVHVGLNADGTISREDFLAKLGQFGDRVRIVAISGASNVTGYINDLDFFARETHRAGASILVDAAQLAPHRPLDMKPGDPACALDYAVFSAHKMYAPFGIGVLVGHRDVFERGDPDTVGGGMVDIVTLEEAYWTDLPEKEEAGTPNIVGVVALAKAIRMYEALGWEAIIAHEAELTAHALRRLGAIPGVVLYGDREPERARARLGVVSFNVQGVPHALTAAILGSEAGIGVRSGCFCAHTYVKELLHVSPEAARELEYQILARDRSQLPGAVRVSFGLYNTTAEVDRLAEAVARIARGEYAAGYVLNREKGEYAHPDLAPEFARYFDL